MKRAKEHVLQRSLAYTATKNRIVCQMIMVVLSLDHITEAVKFAQIMQLLNATLEEAVDLMDCWNYKELTPRKSIDEITSQVFHGSDFSEWIAHWKGHMASSITNPSKLEFH